tara:strand:- start:71 stop:262 length:192 start_codon:yes stop_codon:yes gene_type:complete
MYKNYKLFLFLGAAVIFLYFSVEKYEDFSLKKSISACVIAKSKIKKELKPQEARLICEKEIKN